MLYRGIITFLIIIHAAPSAALRVLSFSMDHIVSGWLISFDTTIDSNCSQRGATTTATGSVVSTLFVRHSLSLSLSPSLPLYTRAYIYIHFELLFRFHSLEAQNVK